MPTTTETIQVPEIHCGHCKMSIEQALAPVTGVDEALVDVAARSVTVTYDPDVTSRGELARVIEEQGYSVPAS